MYDYDIAAEFNENYRYARDFWSPYVEDARVYNMAAAGYTWSETERKEFIKEGREPLELNIMRRPLQYYSGYLRDNINSIYIGPVEDSDQETADQLSEVSSYIWDKGKGYRVFLDACDEALKAGISLCGVYMDYSKDIVNGDAKFYKRTYNSFFLDPTFESIDLSDCGFAITRDLLTREGAKALLPFISPQEINDIQTSFRDDKFLSYHPQFTNTARRRDLVAYDQYYKKVSKSRKFLVDLKSGFSRDITDIPKEEMERLKLGMKRLKDMREEADFLGLSQDEIPMVEIRDAEREFVQLSIFLNGTHVWTGEDKTGIVDRYPFTPILCYFEPSIFDPRYRIQGIPSSLYSNQRNFNQRHMKIKDIMDTEINSGFMYLIGSVADPTELQQTGQSKIIGVDPENAPNGLDSVRQLQGGSPATPALLQYQQVLDELGLQLANINETLLGDDEGGNTQISGRLAQVRTANGVRSNRKVFDNIEASQMGLGNIVLEVIQKNYPPEKVERIIGEKPTQQFYDQEFEQYDAVIKQGVLSQSQRDAYYFELVNLKREGIVDVPQEDIIEALPMINKTKLLENVQRQQKIAEEQQQKIAEQEALQMELANARKEQDLALAQERRARVVSDLALAKERDSEAAANAADAALSRAKTITEIAKMQDDRILQVLEFVNKLEQEEQARQEGITSQILQTSDRLNAETEGSA